jgi:hypothetical protein
MLSRIFKNLYQVPPQKPKNVEFVLVEKAKPRPKSKQKVLYKVPLPPREEKIIRKRNSPEIIEVSFTPDTNYSPKTKIVYEMPKRYNMQFE